MGEHGGSVINTASIGGLVHEAGLGVYNTTKAALIYLTKQLALELSPKIRVNSVASGVVRTRLAEGLWKEHKQELAAAIALNRIGEPDDVAVAIVFLASDAAAWITGETMVSTAACGSATLSCTDAESMPVTEVLDIVGIDPAGR